MTRKQISNAAAQLQSALLDAKVPQAIQSTMEGRPRDLREMPLLAAFRHFSVRAESFQVAERTLIDILGLSALLKTEHWAKMMMSKEEDPIVAHEMYSSVRFSLEHLPKIIKLYQQEGPTLFKTHKDEPDSFFADKQILACTLIEAKNSFSTPGRLREALESVDLLYKACGETLGLPTNDLSVLACDSGSDNTFDFLGGAKIVESVKELILALWDRVVFYRERQMSERIDLIAKSLPLCEKITAMESEKKLEPEKAEILRRQVIEGATKFIESGMTIPEIEAGTEHNPRALLAPSPKLLTEGVTSRVDTSNGGDPSQRDEGMGTRADFTRLTDEERRMYDKLKQKIDGDDGDIENSSSE